MMRRSPSSVALIVSRRAAVAFTAFVAVGLMIVAGCGPSDAPKPKESVATPSPQTKEDTESEESKTPTGPSSGADSAATAEKAPEAAGDDKQGPSGVDILYKTAQAYQKASSYADAGTILFKATVDGEPISETANFSVTLVRPNKTRLQAYQGMFVSDGEKIHAAIENLRGQVLVKPAPAELTLQNIYSDRNLANALGQGIAGGLPQLLLLLADNPVEALLRDANDTTLTTPGQIDGRNCLRVQVERPDGAAVLWIDEENFLLRRIVFPTDKLRQELSQEKPAEDVSLVAEFTGAKINEPVDPKAFAFEVPEGAEIVKFFIPPYPAQLLSKKTPDFEFSDLEDKKVTPASLAGKVVVLDFWASWCGPCKASLPNLETVYQKYKDNDKVAFFAVSIDRPEVDNDELAKKFKDWKVTVPIVRAGEKDVSAFKFSGVPTGFIIGGDGIVQDFVTGGDPNLVESLPEKIEKLLAGKNIYEAPLKEYQEQLDRYAKRLEQQVEQPDQKEDSQEVPKTETAERSEPTTLKLAPLWKCDELKLPGNMLVLQGKNEPTRLLVIEGYQTLVEVGLDGKVIATHPLNLDQEKMEVITNVRACADKDGKRYVVAYASGQQRLHLLDEKWTHVLSFPPDALKNPHSGIADVELADLTGEGVPQILVSYWGVVGVQGVAIDGRRLWSNRSITDVMSLTVGPADDKGQRNLYCTNRSGKLAIIDGKGEPHGEVAVADRPIHTVSAADLRADGQPLWCGLTAIQLGENVAIGFSLQGEEVWNYALPLGALTQPIEPIIAGKVTREGPGQWIFPGPDGSIHFLNADGKLLDKFNYGAALQGLATVEINGHPALIIASPDGLEATKVE